MKYAIAFLLLLCSTLGFATPYYCPSFTLNRNAGQLQFDDAGLAYKYGWAYKYLTDFNSGENLYKSQLLYARTSADPRGDQGQPLECYYMLIGQVSGKPTNGVVIIYTTRTASGSSGGNWYPDQYTDPTSGYPTNQFCMQDVFNPCPISPPAGS